MQIVRIKELDIFLNFGYNSFLHLSNVTIFLYVEKYKYIQGLIPCSNKSKAYTPTAMFPSFFIELSFALH